MADVLIVNTDTSAIGRKTGSNLALLEVIFSVNKRIVISGTPKKKLLFALRNFNEKQHNL